MSEMTLITFPRFCFDSNQFFGYVQSKDDMIRLIDAHRAIDISPTTLLTQARLQDEPQTKTPCFGFRRNLFKGVMLGDFLKEHGFTLDNIIPKVDGYDSTADTLAHKKRVEYLLHMAGDELFRRGRIHDDSKLVEPEKSCLDKAPKLEEIVYGTPEYAQSRLMIDEALRHHYENNSHHPQHYENGINDMNLFDVMEMYFDWVASVDRTKDGVLDLDANATRFSMSAQLLSIFKNTQKRYNW